MRSLTPLALAVLGAIPAAAAQPAHPERDSVSVTGEAEVRVVPDEVVLRVGVETGDKDLGAAKRLNDERVARALAAARKQGIEAKHVQTDHVSVEPRYRGSSELVTDLLGYVVRKSIVITLKDVQKFEAVLTALLEAGVNHVHGVEFRTTELRAHRDRARLLATTAAREKAAALAGALGRKAGRALSINEGSIGWWSGYASWWGGRFGAGMAQNVMQSAGGAGVSDDSSIALGQITVRASVSVVFALE
jgi:uncharacterized protein YggE